MGFSIRQRIPPTFSKSIYQRNLHCHQLLFEILMVACQQLGCSDIGNEASILLLEKSVPKRCSSTVEPGVLFAVTDIYKYHYIVALIQTFKTRNLKLPRREKSTAKVDNASSMDLCRNLSYQHQLPPSHIAIRDTYPNATDSAGRCPTRTHRSCCQIAPLQRIEMHASGLEKPRMPKRCSIQQQTLPQLAQEGVPWDPVGSSGLCSARNVSCGRIYT